MQDKNRYNNLQQHDSDTTNYYGSDLSHVYRIYFENIKQEINSKRNKHVISVDKKI